MFNTDEFSVSRQNQIRIAAIIAIILAIAAGALVAESLLFGALLLLMFLGMLAVVTQPDMITAAVIFIIYINAAVVGFQFHNLPFAAAAGIPLLLLLPFGYRLITGRQKIIINLPLLLLLAFLIVQAAGTIFSINFSESLEKMITFGTEGLLLYFLLINTIRTTRVLRWAAWALILAGLFMGSLSLYQQTTRTFENNYAGFAQVEGRGFDTGQQNLQGDVEQARLEGPIGEKNYYAQIMLALAPLAVFMAFGERSNLLRLLAMLCAAIIAVGIILTFSRGVAIAAILLLAMMVAMRYIKFYQMLLIILGAIMLFQLFPQYGVRLASLESLLAISNQGGAGVAGTDGSTQGRISEMLAAGLVFSEHPLVGVGPGMFKYYYPEYSARLGMQEHTGPRVAHNIFLEFAADYGILGLGLFLAIIGITLNDLIKVRRRWMMAKPDLANIATGLILAISGYLAAGIFLSLAYERYLWLLLAIGGPAAVIAREFEAKSAPAEALEANKNVHQT